MPNLTFIIGQIRALESQLLNQNQLDRMVGAATPLDAFRVLIELQYADYIDESTKPDDFDQILEKGIQETRTRLVEGTENHKGLSILWGQTDLNNLKKAFKLRFLKNQKEIEHFDQDHGFGLIGMLSKTEIENIVFHNIFPENIDSLLKEHIEQSEKRWEKHHNILDIEYSLDKAYFEYFERIANELKTPFIKQFVRLLIDTNNITALARCAVLRNKPLPQETFIDGGDIQYTEIQNIKTEEQFLQFVSHTKFASTIETTLESSNEEKIMHIEKSLEIVYNNFLDEGQSGEINSIQVPISYFNRRIRNAKMIKFIMFAKFNGLSNDVIYEKLKTF
jgi:vacuolar-type H+-ATPase subunit C/Vma6